MTRGLDESRDVEARDAGRALRERAEYVHLGRTRSARILKQQGRVRRVVVLDYELKKRVYSPLAKARGLPPEEYRKLQDEVARDNRLAVVDGKILLPDLRIEYETREGEIARVDLELATDHYKPGQLRDKARAGFRIYRMAQDRSGSSKVWEDRELTAEILSL